MIGECLDCLWEVPSSTELIRFWFTDIDLTSDYYRFSQKREKIRYFPIILETVMLGHWLFTGDRLKMLMADTRCWWLFQGKNRSPSVGDLPTSQTCHQHKTVSNTRLQHRCNQGDRRLCRSGNWDWPSRINSLSSVAF